ncbi:MAG: PEP-CTERM sorting domain-containing protein [Akkermansiaceae bacterium]|nr:PEP-CTERM sorting domain-containing protein [Akkermansiaceae bacterium]
MKNKLFCLAALAITSATGHSAILYSGPQNILISNSFTSVYIDVDAVTSGSAQLSGWDVDAFFGGEAFGNSSSFQPVRQSTSVSSPIVSLAVGDLVDAFDIYASAQAGSSTHIGTGANQFASGVTGYLGFRLIDNNSQGPFYGWMQVNFSNTGAPGTILDWAYENSGAAITVGAVPEPSSVLLLGLSGALGLSIRRRKH